MASIPTPRQSFTSLEICRLSHQCTFTIPEVKEESRKKFPQTLSKWVIGVPTVNLTSAFCITVEYSKYRNSSIEAQQVSKYFGRSLCKIGNDDPDILIHQQLPKPIVLRRKTKNRYTTREHHAKQPSGRSLGELIRVMKI